ncbi:MAG: rod shape-determining protein RodA [Bdellovibrionota bacterium]
MAQMLESETQKVIRTFNLELIATVFSLFIIGMFTLYSATEGPHLQSLCKAQFARFAVGLVLGGLLIFVDSQILYRFSYLFYAFCIVLLLLVLIVGQTGGGSQRWLGFGPIRVQPSELAKIAVIFALARYFSDDKFEPPYTLKRLLIPAAIIAPSALLILVQPDLGTAGVLVLGAGSLILFLGLRWKSILIVALIAIVTVPLTYAYVLKDYQRQRVKTFLDPASDPRGSGYNAIQAKIAVGSGRVFGKGYRKGTQSRLNFIPEQHTDFIFSVLAEERGFVGAVILLVLYFLYCMFALRTVARARDKFEMLLAFGVTAVLFWHVFINLGMVTGLLPIVGVTLPFLSYGGTSILTFLLITGLILNISRKRYIF